MQSILTDGVTLHVHSEGPEDGPVLVLSNSLGTDFRVWDPLLPHLPRGLRIIRYDKRGHGLSDCPQGPWRIEDHAADLEAVLGAFGVTHAVLVGLSVGGLIAQELHTRRPDLLSGIVLMDTAAKIGTAEMWNERIAAIEAGGLAALADPILERWFTPEFRESDPAFPLWRNMLLRTPREGYLRTAAAIRDADYTAQAPRIAVPVLAMAGEQDGSTPPDVVRATAALIPGARFEVIADAGHIPGVEQPQATGALLSGFLRDIGHV